MSESFFRRVSAYNPAIAAAFPHTLPVLAGFMFFGITYGYLMTVQTGLAFGWTIAISALVFAGSMQYVAIPLLAGSFNPLFVLGLTLIVNARHIFYGISMLRRLDGTGRAKGYLIFAMCDETFSILCTVSPPREISRRRFYLAIAVLIHLYWVTASAIGAVLGALLPLDTETIRGMDFVLTALFIVLLVSQWREGHGRTSAIIGFVSAAASLLLFGASHFLLPAMGAIMILLTLLRRYTDRKAVTL